MKDIDHDPKAKVEYLAANLLALDETIQSILTEYDMWDYQESYDTGIGLIILKDGGIVKGGW